MSWKDSEVAYFECRCDSPEHTLRFVYSEEEWYKDDKEAVLYLHIFLTTYGFWRRLKEGLLHIVGYKSRYGHFGEWIMKAEDAERLRDLLTQVIEFNKNNKSG